MREVTLVLGSKLSGSRAAAADGGSPFFEGRICYWPTFKFDRGVDVKYTSKKQRMQADARRVSSIISLSVVAIPVAVVVAIVVRVALHSTQAQEYRVMFTLGVRPRLERYDSVLTARHADHRPVFATFRHDTPQSQVLAASDHKIRVVEVTASFRRSLSFIAR